MTETAETVAVKYSNRSRDLRVRGSRRETRRAIEMADDSLREEPSTKSEPEQSRRRQCPFASTGGDVCQQRKDDHNVDRPDLERPRR